LQWEVGVAPPSLEAHFAEVAALIEAARESVPTAGLLGVMKKETEVDADRLAPLDSVHGPLPRVTHPTAAPLRLTRVTCDLHRK